MISAINEKSISKNRLMNLYMEIGGPDYWNVIFSGTVLPDSKY